MNRSAERYRLIVATAPDPIVVVDRRETIVYANAQTEKLFGHRCDDLLGAHLDVLIPQKLRGIHARHVEMFFEHPAPRVMPSGLALFGLRADGTEMPIEVSLSPVETDGDLFASAAIRDVTERTQVEARARRYAERLAGAIGSIDGAFAIYDEDDVLVACNDLFHKIVAHRDERSLVGRSYEEVLDGWLDDVEFADATARGRYRAECLEERSAPEGVSNIHAKAGRSLRVTNRRTVDGGIVQTTWDLSGDVERERELNEARAASDADSAAKTDFLASMSHELRTPLNAILGFARLLQRDRREPLSTRHSARVEQILRGGEHLLRLIDDILDLSGIEAGRVSISREPVAVVLERVRASLAPMAARQGIRFVVAPVPADLPMVSVDRTRFAQILMNFGSNAIKYHRPGGDVNIRGSLVDGGRVRVAVADTGLGIALEHQPRLFEPFNRAGQETGPIEGTGIGLTICRRLAGIMGAEVGFTSAVGVGSTFWLEIALSRHPAVVLMDTNLPGISGFDALKVLRAYPATANVPVIALTAAASEKERDRGLAAGFFRYLTKPVQVDQLLAALEQVLSPPPTC